MASLVAPLASGIAGAAGGSAEFYVRGTSTTATVYSDANLTAAATTHTLDSNGGIVRYVNASVDVIVRNSANSQVRAFTWEDYAANIEVRNAGWTGVTTGGGSGAGGRTNLDVILSSLYTSLGALDGKVLLSTGASANIKDVIASTGVFFNVQAPSYGALGNGTNDDTAEITAACNAARDAGGGIVYFPEGTYIVTSAINPGAGVMLLGAGRNASIIQTAVNNAFQVQQNDCTIMNLGFTKDTTGRAGAHIGHNTLVLTGLSIVNCKFTGANFPAVSLCATAARIVNCEFNVTEAGGGVVTSAVTSSTGCVIDMVGNRVLVTSVHTGTLIGVDNAAHRANFTGGSISYVQAGNPASSIFTFGGAGKGILSSALIDIATGGGTVVLGGTDTVTVGLQVNASGGTFSLTAAGVAGMEAGSRLPSGTTIAVPSLSRMLRTVHQTINGVAVTIDPAFGCNEVTQSGGAAFAFNTSAPTTGVAAYMTITYKNSSGGAITPTFDSNFKTGTIDSVANGNTTVYFFLWSPAFSKFLQIGDVSTDYA